MMSVTKRAKRRLTVLILFEKLVYGVHVCPFVGGATECSAWH